MQFLFICLIAAVATSEAGLLSFGPAEVHSAPLALRSAPHIEPYHHAHLTHISDFHRTHALHTVPLMQACPLAQISSLVHSPPLNQLDAAHLIHFAVPPQVPISPFDHELLPQPVSVRVQQPHVIDHHAVALAQPLHSSVHEHFDQANGFTASAIHHHPSGFAVPASVRHF